ncbi:MFS transporter [Pontixanthobacter luteolus]|uniref:MFS transporter n=1 Tax=Pontixanthobacter luteolus TaxID=295089 RepID=UPI0023035214|nr:MFS transporter [Pontixanthobacter luteolus]
MTAETRYLTSSQQYALTFVAAVVTANAYYIHPIIGEGAADFGVSNARIGLVPALNQIALAIGILLLLPLGDWFSNRQLMILFVSGQTGSLMLMTFGTSFTLFVAGSTLLGFFTIAPYLLPAYASKRVPPEKLGQVTALLTAGVIFGILLARVGAGIITELYGWRTVYWIATSFMVIVTALLPFLLEKRSDAARPSSTYVQLLSSLGSLAKSHREVILSGAIQGLNFGAFIALWLGLALHLTSPEMGHGVDTVGYLAGIAAVSILSTPRLGRWADMVGPRKARLTFGLIQVAGLALLYPLGFSLIGICIPLVIGNLVGPGVDVTGRMTFLSLAPELRTRLTTIYVVMMFIGGGVGSFLGTAVYDRFDWAGTTALLVLMSGAGAALSYVGWKKFGD